MIADHLPRYYEAMGNDPVYTVEQSFVFDAHEVAWMRFEGIADTYDDDGQKDGTRRYSGHGLYCECDFKEGVGWKVDEKYGAVTLDGKSRCKARAMAIAQRYARLRIYYI